MVLAWYIITVSATNSDRTPPSPTVDQADEETSKADPQLAALMRELHPIIISERCAFAQRCRDLSLSTAHIYLMTLLESHGPLAMTQLAELLQMALPNATGLVDRVHERGIVDRVRDSSDRRVVLVRLTRPGRALLRKLELIRRRRLALALQSMAVAHRDQLIESIHHLRVAYEAAAPKETNS
jgi:DNA-binding MarR family transcriptional regulator